MKKLALTSLLAVFAFTGAHAANVIDGNPLYMPKAGHFYSVTTVGSHTDETPYALGEEFGYGITDRLAVEVSTAVSENKSFEQVLWDDLALKATFRALDMNGFKLDAYGKYTAGDAGLGRLDPEAQGALAYHFDDDSEWFDKDATLYTWTAGVRGGYTTGAFTLAGHVAYEYVNDESFNWKDDGVHRWVFGADAQYVIDSHWSVLAGVEYAGLSNKDVDNAGAWAGELGVNYNIDATKFVGLYVNGALNHQEGHDNDEWGWSKGFGFGAKFGIDF
ncbi:MAG: hypothetical protein IJV03_01460 [Alphaproteobacteria bacterium]|nr:hypothetical protein [Alphaproteobacteria bacterium]